MTAIDRCIATLACGEDLPSPQIKAAMEEILSGSVSPEKLAAWVMGLRVKGETAEEIAGAAYAMRQRCDAVDFGGELLDTCGTGGDGADTFNISTATAFVLASCGVRIAKHGNRAVSSKAGSADVLEKLGLSLDVSLATQKRCMSEVGMAFLFAPRHHRALKHAAAVRKELGIRTIFNLLGPLANPARASHQLMGVFDPKRLPSMASALGTLGVCYAWVVHGEGGLDEVSIAGKTAVSQWDGEVVSHFEISPKDFGEEESDISELVGGDAALNAEIVKAILSGKEKGPKRSVVVLNAAAGLRVMRPNRSLMDCADEVRARLDEGAPLSILNQLVAVARDGSS